MTTQDKTNKKQQKQKKKNQFWLLALKHDFLQTSLSLQTSFVIETRLRKRQWPEEQVNMLKLRNVPSRNPKDDYFEDRRAIFSATENIY
jgi:hypothetical protein